MLKRMETLKVLRLHEQVESCWKTFKEQTLTKKAARQNLLLNDEFGFLLQTLLTEGNEQAKEVAFGFVLKCLKSKIISPTALLTLIQQKMPHMNAPKIISMRSIERATSVLLQLERETGVNFIFLSGPVATYNSGSGNHKFTKGNVYEAGLRNSQTRRTDCSL